MVTVVPFVTILAPKGLQIIAITSATCIDTTGNMGSVESQSLSGEFPGDSETLDTAQFVFTPDVLERCWRDLDPSPELEMPWETGIWGNIFCNKPLFSVPQPKWKRLPCPESSQAEPLERPAKVHKRVSSAEHWKEIVSNTDAVSWKESQEAKMDVALKRWFDIITQFPNVHETVKQLQLVAGLPEQLRMLRDILSGKFPATLVKRANSMLKYIEKLRDCKVQVPGDEAFLYSYFCELRNSGVAMSRLRSLVEAIRFTEFVFGMEGLCSKLLSRRCIGASRRVGEEVVKQSNPFTVSQLSILHEELFDPKALFWDRLVSGAALMATYTRSRWMDMQHTDEVVMDPDFTNPVFELKIKEFKTKKANAWRGGTMAAVAPALGVVQGNWAKVWWDLRQQLGGQIGVDFPLMPAPDAEGEPTVRPLSTGEFGKWIRMILNRKNGLSEGSKVTSHSCKATMLSFLAKFGASVPDREILGGHTSRMKSVLTYSRDSLASPLRVLATMLEAVRQGSFEPDSTRSGMFRPEVKLEVLTIEDDEILVEPEEQQQTELDEEAGDDIGSGSDTSSSSEEEQAASTHAARMVCSPKAPAGTELRQHPKSRMLHLIQEEHKRFLLCGRKVEMANGRLYKPPLTLRWDTPCCSHCWRAANTPLGSRLQ